MTKPKLSQRVEAVERALAPTGDYGMSESQAVAAIGLQTLRDIVGKVIAAGHSVVKPEEYADVSGKSAVGKRIAALKNILSAQPDPYDYGVPSGIGITLKAAWDMAVDATDAFRHPEKHVPELQTIIDEQQGPHSPSASGVKP